MAKEAGNQNTRTPAAKAPTELSDEHLDQVQGADSRRSSGSTATVKTHNQLWGDWFQSSA